MKLALAMGLSDFAQRGPQYTDIINLNFLNSQTPESAGASVSRALPAYASTLAGLLTSTASNVARVTNKGLLVEGSKKNFIVNSETFNSSTGVTIPLTNIEGPDGTFTASKMQQTSANSGHWSYRGTFAGMATANQIASAYMKMGTWRYGYIENVSQGGGSCYMVIDLLTGDFSVGNRPGAPHTNVVGYVEPCANGWWRCSLSSTATSTTVSSFNVGMAYDMSYAWEGAFVGSTSNYIYVAKSTLTNGVVPTSPVDTTGTSVTRPEDAITFAQSKPSGIFEISVGFTSTWGFAPLSPRTLFHWHDGTDNNAVLLELSTANKVVLKVINGGVTTTVATEGGTQPLRRSATAKVVCDGTRWGLYVDNVFINSVVVASPAVTTLRLGAARSSGNTYDDYLTSLTLRTGGSALSDGSWSFDGTAGSGFSSVPTDDTRVTSKPGARWVTVPKQVITVGQSIDLEVLADAKGGVAYVDFIMEGITTRQAVPTVKNVADVNGVMRKRTTYSINVPYSTLIAANAAGGAFHCYARVKALDDTMQTRLIGPLKTYFRPTVHDWVKTVSPTGFAQDGTTPTDYTTLQAAEDAAIAANAACPKIILARTDSYNIVRTSMASTLAETKGRPVITHAAGVVATLVHTSRDLTTPSTQMYYCRLDDVELRGSGIVIDNKNITQIVVGNNSKPWANGIKFTSTEVGGRDSLAYNLGPPLTRGFTRQSGGSPGPYFTDCVVEYGTSPYQDSEMVIHCHNRKIYGDMYSRTKLVAWNEDKGLSAAFFRDTTQPFFNIASYPAGATIQKTGTNGTGTMIFGDGAGTLTLTLASTPEAVAADGTGNTVFTVAELVAKVNARAGWSLNTTGCDTSRGVRFVYGKIIAGGDVNQFPQTTLTGATSLYSLIDIHGDWYQTYGGVNENILVHGNQVLTADNDTDLSAYMFMDDTGGHRDFFVRGNVFPSGSPGNSSMGGAGGSHVVVEENTLGIFGCNNDLGDLYQSCQNNYIDTFVRYQATWPSFDIKNNVYRTATSAPNGTNSSGNVASGISFSAAFVSSATDDYRPSASLYATLKAKRSDYDIMSTARSATDAVGAYSKNASARTFWTFT